MRITRTAASAAGLCLALLAGGCVGQTHIAYKSGLSSHLDRPAPVDDPPPRPHPLYQVVPDVEVAGHEVLQIWRPAPCGDVPGIEWGATAYVSRAPGPRPWIIVLPIWGSSVYPSQKTVKWVLDGKHGPETSILWIHGARRLMNYPALKSARTEEEFSEAVDRSAACIDDAVEDVRGFADWIDEQPGSDPNRIGIVGYSIGAIVGSLVMGRDPRFAAGVFAMGGGHLDQIFSYCFGAEEEVRENCRTRFGWGPEEFEAAVKPPLAALDPVLVAGNIDPAKVLYIDAGRDGCIPESARDDLWEAMGRPERVTLDLGHKTAFLSMTVLGFNVTTFRIVHFLEKRLYAPKPRGGGAPPGRMVKAGAQ